MERRARGGSSQLVRGGGLPEFILLGGTGIVPGELEACGSEVDGSDELQVARNLVAIRDSQPGLGVESAELFSFGGLGTLGLALMAAPTVREALQLAIRMQHLTFAFVQPVHERRLRGSRDCARRLDGFGRAVRSRPPTRK